jgi:general nucleoside transport system permease protein
MEIIPVLKSAVTIMIPILFAAAGGLFPALAGTLNIALEGLLLAGAFSSLAVFHFTGNIALSVIAAIITAMSLSAIHIFASYKLRANVFISGLAVNLFTGGLCTVLSEKLFNTRGVVVFQNDAKIPSSLINWYLFFLIILLSVSWLAVNKTPFGFRLRSCEKNSEALASLGIDPQFYRITALLISGFACGIGGSFLSLNIGAFVPGMSAGKGWIALVAVFLGGRKPQGILAAAFVFGIAESFSNHAQGIWSIPADFILAFPYICTLSVLIIVSVILKISHNFKI